MSQSWSFWLQRNPAGAMPTYDAALTAMQHALPGWTVHTSVAPLGGNPRDGHLHTVAFHATHGPTSLRSDFGIYSTFGPTMEEDALYGLESISMEITSTAPWSEQYAVWQAIVQAFASLEFTDLTLRTPVFMDGILAYLYATGEERTAATLLARSQSQVQPRRGTTFDLTSTGHYDRDALLAAADNLHEITSFSLEGCRTSHVPTRFSELTHLTSLSLARNTFTHIPVELRDMPHLAYLSLEKNALTELPEWIGNLPALKTIYLAGNPLIAHIEEWRRKFPHIILDDGTTV